MKCHQQRTIGEDMFPGTRTVICRAGNKVDPVGHMFMSQAANNGHWQAQTDTPVRRTAVPESFVSGPGPLVPPNYSGRAVTDIVCLDFRRATCSMLRWWHDYDRLPQRKQCFVCYLRTGTIRDSFRCVTIMNPGEQSEQRESTLTLL